MRIDVLANKCKLAYDTLGVFSGTTGGSRIKLHKDAIESKQSAIGPIQNRGREIAESWSQNRDRSEEELRELRGQVFPYRIIYFVSRPYFYGVGLLLGFNKRYVIWKDLTPFSPNTKKRPGIETRLSFRPMPVVAIPTRL
jgi:hypothetical protein